MNLRFSFFCSILSFAFVSAANAENWPQWRGPKNDGISSEKNLPVEWGQDKNVVWKLKMPGKAQSTPCVWGDKIFLTSVDGSDVVMLCVGVDGKQKWSQKIAATGSGRSGRGDEGNDASASCSTDGKHVWTFAGGGKLVCYTVEGKPVWNLDLNKYGKLKTQFGCHWTPVLYKGKLYLQVMHRNAQIVLALDALTGAEIWKVERPGYSRGESPDVYASGFMWEGEGGPLFVAHGNDFCTGHKLEDGAEVWRVEALNPRSNPAWRFVSCPLVTSDLIVVPSCKNGPTVAFNPVGAKGTIDPSNKAELWRSSFTPDVVSPLRVDDMVYLLNGEILLALDAKTGSQVYRKPLAKQTYRGNMVYGDGKIYVVGLEGIGQVIQPGKDFKILATNALKEKVHSSPAISNGRIYIRTWEHLYCIGTKRPID